MRLPNSAHEGHPWVMTGLAPDFRLLDAWALPAEGGAEDFGAFVELMTELDPADAGLPSRALFWLRQRLGGVLRLDARKARPIPGCPETTLRDRLRVELRGSADGPAISGALQREAGFTPLYRTDDEWAAEISNETVHAVLQLGWVDEGTGRYRGRLGIYVKPRGRLGEAYLLLIGPFRHLIVYPALMRQVDRAWNAHRSGRDPVSAPRRSEKSPSRPGA